MLNQSCLKWALIIICAGCFVTHENTSFAKTYMYKLLLTHCNLLTNLQVMTLFSLHTFQGESEKADCPSKQRERRPKEKMGLL